MDNSAVAIGNPAAAEWVPVASLTVWDQNPKPHDAANLKEIARSIRRFDFGAPIVAWKSQQRVVAGHGRLEAARLLLTEDPGRLLATDAPGPGLVPVRWVEFASEQEAAAYALVDNRLTEANPMDEAQVAAILASFEGPVEIPGYDEEALSALLERNEPGSSVWEGAMGSLPDTDRVPIQQMTFTLHDEQVIVIKQAIDKAKSIGDFIDTGNENSNGNALARIAEMFLGLTV